MAPGVLEDPWQRLVKRVWAICRVSKLTELTWLLWWLLSFRCFETRHSSRRPATPKSCISLILTSCSNFKTLGLHVWYSIPNVDSVRPDHASWINKQTTIVFDCFLTFNFEDKETIYLITDEMHLLRSQNSIAASNVFLVQNLPNELSGCRSTKLWIRCPVARLEVMLPRSLQHSLH